MNLGIDISQIVYEGTGVARFTRGLTEAILAFDRENKWTFFISSLRKKLDIETEKKIIGKGHKIIKWKLPPSILSFLWNDLHSFSKLITFNLNFFNSLDWFITSDWTEPPLPVKKATIIHDLVFLRYPETVNPVILNTQEKRLSWVKKESRLIFADSQSTENDLRELLKIKPDKITVNYPGIEIRKPSGEQINKTLKKYRLVKPFILTVGKLEPRKNIPRLIEAFSKTKISGLDLVIVGPPGWNTMGIQSINRLHTLPVNVRYLNYIENDELYSLYSACKIFIFPSLWEGFGYPVIEAMKLSVPVITSDNSSLREIGKEAALLCDPMDTDSIAKAISQLSADEKLRLNLIKKGRERSKIFSWSAYYYKLIKTLYANRG